MAKEKTIASIMETSDYDKFKFVVGNRHIDRKHVDKIKGELKMKVIVDPIMVNKDMGILDGQHRYTARKELGLPIQYYVGQDMTPEEIARMNDVAKKWKPENYADVYLTESYRVYRSFRQIYPQFNHSIAIVLLTNGNSVGDGDAETSFRQGKFLVRSINKADTLAKNLIAIGEFTPVYKRRSFVYALMRAMDVKGFDIKRFVRKLPHKGHSLKDYGRSDDFLAAIEQVYNWKEPETHRLRLSPL